MNPIFVQILGFAPRPTNAIGQKIDESLVRIYKIVSASFLLKNSLEKVRFFKEIFLLADTNLKIVLGMPFLFLSNTDLKFDTGEFI